MIIANKYNVPDSCPKDCKFKDEAFYQGCICMRCPILNCRKDEDGFCMIEPEEFREDWAIEWEEYFINNKEPILKIRKTNDYDKS